MSDKTSDDARRERAALYALGALPEAEARDVATELAGDGPAADAELSAFRSVVDDLAYAAAPMAPPPPLRKRLLEQIAAGEAPVVERDGIRFVRSAQLGWEAGVADGIEVKPLFTDPATGRRTVLVRMQPGTTYPAHRHADNEETFLLEGDLLVGGVLMRPGDYCLAPADTMHEGIQTTGGCLFITSAAQRSLFLD